MLIVPGGSCHVNSDTPDGLDQEAVIVSRRHLLALVKVTFSDALN